MPYVQPATAGSVIPSVAEPPPILLLVVGPDSKELDLLADVLRPLGASAGTEDREAESGSSLAAECAAVCEYFLSQIGDLADGWAPVRTDAFQTRAADRTVSRLVQAIRRHKADESLLVIANRLAGLLLPLWTRACELVPVDLKIIGSLAFDVESPESSTVLSEPEKQLRWLKYVIAVADPSIETPRAFRLTPIVNGNWRAAISQFERDLSIKFPTRSGGAELKVDAIIRASRGSLSVDASGLNGRHLTSWMLQAVRAMGGLEADPTDARSFKSLDQIKAAFDDAAANLESAVCALTQAAADTQAKVGDVQKELAEQYRENEEIRSSLAQSTQQLSDAQNKLDDEAKRHAAELSLAKTTAQNNEASFSKALEAARLAQKIQLIENQINADRAANLETLVMRHEKQKSQYKFRWLAEIADRSVARRLAKSGLFDRGWYLDKYSDVRSAKIDPVLHYVQRGFAEGRMPNPLFDTQWYLRENPDVGASGLNPLLHYLTSGGAERRDPGPCFLTSWYLEQVATDHNSVQNPLVHFLKIGRASGLTCHPLIPGKAGLSRDQAEIAKKAPAGEGHEAIDAPVLFEPDWYALHNTGSFLPDVDYLHHFLTVGWRLNFDPHPLFDMKWYLLRNPDVAAAGINPFIHYLARGWKEGRSPHPIFDPVWYQDKYLKGKAAVRGINPLVHYLASGWRQGFDPHPLFAGKRYIKENPDVDRVGTNPLVDFVTSGWSRGRSPHPLFDMKWYLANYSDVKEAGINPLTHYIAIGWREGRKPHPSFDSDWYCQQNPDVALSETNPLVHYVTSGHRENRNPHPLFDQAWYLRFAPSSEDRDMAPLTHFVRFGSARGLSPHPLFNTQWYRDTYPAVSLEGIDALSHFLSTGWKEGRSPHPLFDMNWYLAEYPDVQKAKINPVLHYLSSGWQEGRDPSPYFNGVWYKLTYDDVGQSQICPLIHFLQLPEMEIRPPHPLFDPFWYSARYHVSPDRAFFDYVAKGAGEGRLPGPQYDHAIEALQGDVTLSPAELSRFVFRAVFKNPASVGYLAASPRGLSVLDSHYEIIKFPAKLADKDVCLFVAYAPEGIVHEASQIFIEEMRQAGLKVVVIASTERIPTISNMRMDQCDGLIVRDNEGYDFACWALALQALPELWEANSVIFVNDSVFGPTSPDALTMLLGKIKASTADYIGLVESDQVTLHTQSFFFVLKNKCLGQSEARKFWKNVRVLQSKHIVIHDYEIGYRREMEKLGFKIETLFPLLPSEINLDINPTLDLWRSLIERGLPFLKVQLLRDQIGNIDITNWRDYFFSNAKLLEAIDRRLSSSSEQGRRQVIARSKKVSNEHV